MSLTQMNRHKRCVNIPRSKKGTQKHKYKCGLSHSPGKLITSYSGRNDSHSMQNNSRQTGHPAQWAIPENIHTYTTDGFSDFEGERGSRLWNSEGMGRYLRLEIRRHGGIP